MAMYKDMHRLAIKTVKGIFNDLESLDVYGYVVIWDQRTGKRIPVDFMTYNDEGINIAVTLDKPKKAKRK